MPRRFKPTERFITGDARYGSKLVTKFVNNLMWDGKKMVAFRIFYDAMDVIAERIDDDDPIDVFIKAIDNVKPRVEVRSKRVGGATYQVPIEVNRRRQQALAMRWILDAMRSKKGRPAHRKLADEIINAYRGEGSAIHKKITVHKMAEANKAFAHFSHW